MHNKLNKLLILASIFCAVEASFRSKDELMASFANAERHPAKGAAVIVLEKVGDHYNISNGVLIKPGLALTHAHETRDKAWVISLHAGGRLVYRVEWEKNKELIECSSPVIDLTKTLRSDACREVKCQYIAPRKIVNGSVRTIDVELTEAFNLERIIEMASEGPTEIFGGGAFFGRDLCLLSFEPFDPSHPIASIRQTGLSPDSVVSILGHSMYTRFCGVSGCVDYREVIKKRVAAIVQKQEGKSESGSMHVNSSIGFTSFHQLVTISSKEHLFVLAAWDKRAISRSRDVQMELFDPTKTDCRTEALGVSGLSGAGVFDEEGALVGIVSRAHVPHTMYLSIVELYQSTKGTISELQEQISLLKQRIRELALQKASEDQGAEQTTRESDILSKFVTATKVLEDTETKLAKSRGVAEDIEKCLSTQSFPLLNLHEVVTQADIDSLLLGAHPASG